MQLQATTRDLHINAPRVEQNPKARNTKNCYQQTQDASTVPVSVGGELKDQHCLSLAKVIT